MPSDSKVGFVTGGGSGIGRATALALADSGHAVMVTDLDPAAAESTAKEISQAGGRAAARSLEVTDEAQVRDAVAATVSLFGTLDSAVNCAGIQGDLAPTGECSLGNWERTLAVNLTGTFLCVREEIRAMQERGGGSIVNISSNFGIVGKTGIPAYCASKHGVIGLTKTAALDYADQGIRVNTVSPGPTMTPMLDKLVAESGERGREMLEQARNSIPMRRIGESEEVAAAVVWLCSDAASFMTGTTVPVDGGFVVG